MAKKTLVHLSDLHFGGGHREHERAAMLFDRIAQRHAGAPVLVTGDTTQSGTARQCRQALAMLKQLARTNPVLAVPGNHDYGFHGIHFQRKAYRNWYKWLSEPMGRWPAGTRAAWLGEDNQSGLGVLAAGGAVYFGLDSCDPDDHEVSARGWISRRLAALLEAELRNPQYAGQTRVVLLHHHPFEGSALTALDGSKRLMRALEGRCEVLIFGHHHHCGVWWKRSGISLIVGSHKSTNRLFGDSLGIGLIELREMPGGQVDFDFQVESGEELAAA